MYSIHVQWISYMCYIQSCYYQEYIIERRESIELHYSTVLQPFLGVMTLMMIFTNVRLHLSMHDCTVG